MSHDLFEAGTGIFIPALPLSLALTIVVYGTAPGIDPNSLVMCKARGHTSRESFESRPKCGKFAKQYVSPNPVSSPGQTARLRRMCAGSLVSNARCCHKCGTMVQTKP